MQRTVQRRHLSVQAALLSAGILAVCLLIAFLTPYTHEDWGWGSSYGMGFLREGFSGLNGRYMGNLLILAVTRSVMVKTLVVGLSMGLTILYLGRERGRQGLSLTALAATLYFTMPQSIAQQTIGWMSGYCNYAMGTLPLLILMRRAFLCFEGRQTCTRTQMAFYAVTGFVGALFMETVTLALMLCAVLLCLYTFGRDKRVDAGALCLAAGALLGGVLMFSNNAYGMVAANKDFYRTISFNYWDNIGEVMQQVRWFFHDSHLKHMFLENLPLLFLILFLTLMAMYRLRGEMDAQRMRICAVVAMVLFLYPLYLLLRTVYPAWELFLSYTGAIEEVLGLFYIGALVFLPCALPVGMLRRKRMGTILFMIAVLAGPLLFVTPIGPRCFYPIFILEIAYALELARACRLAQYYRLLRLPLLSVLAALCVFFVSIYARNAMVHNARTKAAKAEAALGQNIRLAQLPYEEYSWDSHIYHINEAWFRERYGIAPDVTIEMVDYTTWYREHR